MPYPNWHAARVVEPSKVEDETIVTSNNGNSESWKGLPDGVDVIQGKLKTDPKGSLHVQAYRFNKNFTAKEAKDWLETNKVEYIDFEPAKEMKKASALLDAARRIIFTWNKDAWFEDIDITDDYIIYSLLNQTYRAPFTVDEKGLLTIAFEQAEAVSKVVNYTPVTKHEYCHKKWNELNAFRAEVWKHHNECDADGTPLGGQTPSTIRPDAAEYPIIKMDAEKHYVLVPVCVPNLIDTQKEWMSVETIENFCWQWGETTYLGKAMLKTEHSTAIDKKDVVVVENYVLREAAFGLPAGTWMLGLILKADALWESAKEGKFTGISIGGLAARRKAEPVAV